MTVVGDVLRGFARIYVLRRAAEGPVYGLVLLEELQRRGYALGPGTLYPLLHGLEDQGLLARENRIVGGRVRKYYVLTPAGARTLADARSKIQGLVGDMLEIRRPARRGPVIHGAGERPPGLIRPDILRARLTARATRRTPVVIDVRDDEEYVAGHLPGARHIPADELAARYRELPGRRLHVTYCNMRHRDTARSVRAAALLREQGREAHALDGGFPAWAAAGYPVERGRPA